MTHILVSGLSKEIIKGAPLTHVRAVAVDSSGYVYVTNAQGNEVYKADISGTPVCYVLTHSLAFFSAFLFLLFCVLIARTVRLQAT